MHSTTSVINLSARCANLFAQRKCVYQIGVSFHPANEIAAITVNSVEGPVFEVAQVDEQDTISEPRSKSAYFCL